MGWGAGGGSGTGLLRPCGGVGRTIGSFVVVPTATRCPVMDEAAAGPVSAGSCVSEAWTCRACRPKGSVDAGWDPQFDGPEPLISQCLLGQSLMRFPGKPSRQFRSCPAPRRPRVRREGPGEGWAHRYNFVKKLLTDFARLFRKGGVSARIGQP